MSGRHDRERGSVRLHASNLSASATLASVRQFFAVAGDVLEVEFIAERNQVGKPSSAFVTMATLDAAEAAVRKLHRRLFHDRSMMVAIMEEREGGPRSSGGPAKPKAVVGVCVSQQYRERQGMVYELDCSGMRVTVRFFFQDDGSKVQRVEARATHGSEFVAEATAATRELALVAVAEAWSNRPDGATSPSLDWPGVTAALKTVRAV